MALVTHSVVDAFRTMCVTPFLICIAWMSASFVVGGARSACGLVAVACAMADVTEIVVHSLFASKIAPSLVRSTWVRAASILLSARSACGLQASFTEKL